MRGVLASSDDCIKVLDLQANLVFMSEGGQRVMEVSDFNAIRGCPWPDFWQDQGNTDAKEAVRIALAGGSGRFQGAANTAAGTPKYWDVQVTPILGAGGKPEMLLSISRDITELKRAHDNQHFMMQEMVHRMKNMLALVQAISSQTFRAGVPLDDAKTTFNNRIVALANTQDALLNGFSEQADLVEIMQRLRDLHSPGDASRIAVRGDSVLVGPDAAVAIALSLHEFATNAVKYGALSNETGRADVTWAFKAGKDGPLSLSWREIGGPPVVTPQKAGFGSRLIQRVLGSSDDITLSVNYLPEGLQAEIVMPPGFLQA
jgi:two-component sensor histidine kinase